ncbi:hypothetical protein [Hymenobacter sp. CRA2]|uniref:hypothetical protein n=1 Tax=Hymenobacter sp. CRA2 TaxID=1955620 RepID=UPI0009902557|nr:hypothetical protein [Hymenobacter sp. CRA2]OON68211.1 hypothetical protein B0919_13710 [Hymenobacter sp. CRA2]
MPPRITCREDALPALQQAVDQANQVLARPEFYAGIRKHKDFKSTKVKPATIAQLIESCELEFHVDTFEPNEDQGKTLGLFSHKRPTYLSLNATKLANRSGWSSTFFIEDVASTIIHESVHAVDHANPDYRFGHKNRKRGSAPYWIGNHAFHLLTHDPVLELAFDRITEIDEVAV